MQGETIRVIVYIKREDYRLLKIALAIDELTVSAWFRDNATTYTRARLSRISKVS